MSTITSTGRTLTLACTLTCAAGLALAASLPSALHAQRPARLERSSFVPRSGASLERRDQTLSMRKMLRLLTTAQEQHFAGHSAYTTRLDLLRGGFRAAWDDSVDLRITWAGARAWSGVATHRSLPGRSCVIFVGPASELPALPRTEARRLAPTEEGVPVCDEG